MSQQRIKKSDNLTLIAGKSWVYNENIKKDATADHRCPLKRKTKQAIKPIY